MEELLAERGIKVDHVTVFRWVQRFTPLLIDAARPCWHTPNDRWFADETYVKIAGRWVYLYRAIDQFGQVIEVMVSEKRDLAATRRFFTLALRNGLRPTQVTIDRAPAYPRALDELVPAACHVMQMCQVDPTWNEHPLRGLSGVTGRLAHRFSLSIWVGMWGLLDLAHHRVSLTGQARPTWPSWMAFPAGLVGGRVHRVWGPRDAHSQPGLACRCRSLVWGELGV